MRSCSADASWGHATSCVHARNPGSLASGPSMQASSASAGSSSAGFSASTSDGDSVGFTAALWVTGSGARCSSDRRCLRSESSTSAWRSCSAMRCCKARISCLWLSVVALEASASSCSCRSLPWRSFASSSPRKAAWPSASAARAAAASASSAYWRASAWPSAACSSATEACNTASATSCKAWVLAAASAVRKDETSPCSAHSRPSNVPLTAWCSSLSEATTLRRSLQRAFAATASPCSITPSCCSASSSHLAVSSCSCTPRIRISSSACAAVMRSSRCVDVLKSSWISALDCSASRSRRRARS
mmetsp:Transcript_3841/g.11325  ORF Transcript_3841/g.11325 Transcript_3841/m.11325 type:complete len:304 (+) Transcript_3841:499-1410(+)